MLMHLYFTSLLLMIASSVSDFVNVSPILFICAFQLINKKTYYTIYNVNFSECFLNSIKEHKYVKRLNIMK